MNKKILVIIFWAIVLMLAGAVAALAYFSLNVRPKNLPSGNENAPNILRFKEGPSRPSSINSGAPEDINNLKK